MSYILEALKRATAERERESGQPPGLHARPLPMAAPGDDASQGRFWLWVGLGTVVALAAAGGLWWQRMAASDVLPAGAMAPVNSPLTATGPALATPAAAPAPVAMPVPAAPAPAPPVVRAEPPIRAAGIATATVAVTTRPAASASAPSAPHRVLTLPELPDDVRTTASRLVVNGAVYSDVPADRLLIINGQPVREGDAPAPGMLVERIGAKSAVLRAGNLRFALNF